MLQWDVCFHFCAFFLFLQCIIRSLPTHMLFLWLYPPSHSAILPCTKNWEVAWQNRETQVTFFNCLFLNFSAEVAHIQDLELCNCIFLKKCKWTLIRLTLNNKIECTSSEQIKLHQGIKSISKNSACDEGIQQTWVGSGPGPGLRPALFGCFCGSKSGPGPEVRPGHDPTHSGSMDPE